MIEPANWENLCYETMVQTAMAALCMENEQGFFVRAYARNTSLMELTPMYDPEAGELKRQDICYITIRPKEAGKQGVFTQQTKEGLRLISHIPFTAKFAFYGDKATAYAGALRTQLERNVPLILKGIEFDNPQEVLKGRGIVKDKVQKNIFVIPELYQGDWIQRADFDFSATVEVTEDYTMAAIEKMGELTIRSEK